MHNGGVTAKKRNNLRRKASDPCNHTLKAPQPRARIQSSPASLMIDRAKIPNDSRLTEAAKELSDEELASPLRGRSEAFGFLCRAAYIVRNATVFERN